MTILHRESCFGKDSIPKSGYLWCLHCERAYKYGEFRNESSRWSEKDIEEWARGEDEKVMLREDFQMCPYPDCSGSTVLDGWNWEDIRERHPEFPEIPEHGVVYPLY